MSRIEYKDWAVNSTGDVVGGSAVEVRVQSTGALADLYDAETAGSLLSNPLTAEDDGSFVFFVEPGKYDVTVGSGASESTVPLYALRSDITYPTIAAMALAETAAVGDVVSVDAAFNGGREEYEATAGGLTADGALVVDGVGVQWVSKRTVYADAVELAADVRTFAGGTVFGMSGFPIFLEAVSVGGDITNAGGQAFSYTSGSFSSGGKKYQIVSCVLRQTSVGSGWDVIDDANHAPVGLDTTTPVEELNGDIKLNYSFNSEKIGSLVVTPDEGYAATELTFGSSVGGSSAFISLYHPFFIRTNGTGKEVHTYSGPEANDNTLSDGDWYAESNTSEGTWTITHRTESHSASAGSPVSIERYAEDVNVSRWGTTSRTKSGFTVQAFQGISGRTNGATVISSNVGPQTVSWDGTSTMTITHPASTNTNDAMAISQNALYPAVITGSTSTSISVQFLNAAAGSVYSGSSAPTNVRYMRSADAPSSLTGGTKFKAERLGRVKVDAQYVSGGSSNLWVFGVFEID